MPRSTPDEPAPTALVTGAARGIGAATAIALHGAGHRVVLADLDGATAQAVAAQIGEGARGVTLDVTDHEAVVALLDEVEATWGQVQVLVNNAGIMPLGQVVDEPRPLTRAILDINAVAMIEATKEFVERRTRDGGSGHVINVSSAAGHVPMPGAATYTASKHAVTGFSNAVHLELRSAKSPVRVSVVHPGMVATDIAAGFTAGKGPFGAVTPERVASAIVKVIRRPRANVYVPGFLALALALQGITPPRMREWSNDRFGGEAALQAAGSPGRRAYDARVSHDIEESA